MESGEKSGETKRREPVAVEGRAEGREVDGRRDVRGPVPAVGDRRELRDDEGGALRAGLADADLPAREGAEGVLERAPGRGDGRVDHEPLDPVQVVGHDDVGRPARADRHLERLRLECAGRRGRERGGEDGRDEEEVDAHALNQHISGRRGKRCRWAQTFH